MSSNHNGNRPAPELFGFGGMGRMSEERPLDALLPGLGKSTRKKSEPIAASPLHPRVLEVKLEDGWEWTLGAWSDPGARALSKRLKELIQATVLAELSKSPDSKTASRNFGKMRLLVFSKFSDKSLKAIEKIGFSADGFSPDQYAERVAAWQDEARAAGLDAAARPTGVYVLDITRAAPVLDQNLRTIQGLMTKRLAGEFWGQTPGGPSRLMATYLRQYFNATVTPDRKGLHELELFIVQDRPQCLRWVDPAIFQALCDFVGVILRAVYDLKVQWGVCTPDASGFATPPVFRVKRPDGYQIVPISLHVLNWCVMPRSDDDAPTLAQAVDALAAELR